MRASRIARRDDRSGGVRIRVTPSPSRPSTRSPSRWPIPKRLHASTPTPSGWARQVRTAGIGCPDHGLPRIHAVARRGAACRRQRAVRLRGRGRGDGAEAGREVHVGLRRRRAGARRRDLEPRDVDEEGHRPGHPGDRQHRAPARAPRTWQRASGSTSTAGSPSPRASAATSTSPSRRVRSAWASTSAARSPSPPASLPRAPDRTGSRINGGAGSFTDPDGFAWGASPE